MARPTRRPLPGAAVAALMFALAVFAPGCAEKVTTIDPSMRPPVYPPGVPADAKLMLYQDTPIRRVEWADLGLPGVTPEDTLISDELIYETGPGVVQGMIVDFSNASSFDIFREGTSGGYEQLSSVPVNPVKKWLIGQADIFRFQDPAPVASRSYIGRGRVSGLVNAQSPLTNVAQLSLNQVAGDLQFYSSVVSHTDANGNPVETSPQDTLHDEFRLAWKPVPGAVGYWLSVVAQPDAYLQGSALIKSSLPRPVYPERFPEYLVTWLTPAAVATSSPDTLRYNLIHQPTFGAQVTDSARWVTYGMYAVRIVAVDANGQVLSYTRDDAQKAAFAFQRTSTSYVIFPLGCVIVKPAKPDDPANPPPPYLASAPRTGLGGRLHPGQTMVVTADQLRAARRR